MVGDGEDAGLGIHGPERADYPAETCEECGRGVSVEALMQSERQQQNSCDQVL